MTQDLTPNFSKATSDVEQYIGLRAGGTERILLSDIVERFSRRPYGWPDAEILLIVGRLASAGRISFQLGGGTLPVKEAFETLQNARRRREVSIVKKRQIDEAVLKQARNLTQDIFSSTGPATEKELFEFYTQNFSKWLNNLTSYKSKTDVGRFPGKKVIEQSILTLERLLSNNNSFDFFKQVVDKKEEYLALEEGCRDIHEFFSKQIPTWQQLQHALHQFDKNRQALEKDADASNALSELQSIEAAEAPYGMLHKVASLVSTVEAVNKRLLTEKRTHAIARVDDNIKQLEAEIAKSGMATPELSNRLLRPLQLIKADLEIETSIAGIYMLQTETTKEHFDDGLYELERAVQVEIERRAKDEKAAEAKVADSSSTDTGQPGPVTQSAPTVARPKPVIEVNVSSVYEKSCEGVYLETEESVDQFVEALKAELMHIVRNEKRVRIR